MSHLKYDNYQESGIETIGQIPENWSISRLKGVSTIFGRIGFRGYSQEDIVDFEEGAITVSPSNMKNGHLDFSKNTYLSWDKYDESPEIKLENGDVIMVKTGSTIGKVSFAETINYPSTINPQLMIFKQIKCHKKFLFYYLFSDNIQSIIPLYNTGSTIPTMTQEAISKLPIPLPSTEEQEKIVTYLDRETSRIDELIEKKQAFIEKLKEKRISIISTAVTKGLNSHTEIKNCGVEWLGETPKHWEVKKLKYNVTKVGSGITPNGGATIYEETGIPLIRSQNIYSDRFKLDDVAYINEEIHNSMNNSKVKSGDVLLNITGASLGRCFYMIDTFKEANVNQHVCIIRPNQIKLHTKFLHLLMISDAGQNQIWNDQTGSGREGLNFVSIKNFLFAFPPEIKEQLEIVDYVTKETNHIDRVISKTELAIDKLKEYKTALISSVVTGKIKVTV